MVNVPRRQLQLKLVKLFARLMVLILLTLSASFAAVSLNGFVGVTHISARVVTQDNVRVTM